MNILVPLVFFAALLGFFGYKYYKKHYGTKVVVPPATTDTTKK